MLEDGNSGGDTGETDAADTEFTQEATLAWAGVTSDPVAVEVDIRNTGSKEGAHEVTLQANGETVASESVTVAEGEAETITLTHTFKQTGEHRMTVGDEQRTLTVYKSPAELFAVANFDQGTRVSEEETVASGAFVQDGTEYDVEIAESTRIRTDYDEETQYTVAEGTTEVLGRSTEERLKSGLSTERDTRRSKTTVTERSTTNEGKATSSRMMRISRAI